MKQIPILSGQDESNLGVMPWPIQKWTGAANLTVPGGVVVEEPLEIRLDGQPVAVLMRTPGLEKELAVGFCLGEGLVADMQEVSLVHHCGQQAAGMAGEDPLDESRNRVDIFLRRGRTPAARKDGAVLLVRSGCGRTDGRLLAEGLAPVRGGGTIDLQVLFRLPAQITRRQAAYRTVGGIHAAAVFQVNGRPVVVCEDIGRHNAVDKVVGFCLLRGIPLHDKILVGTGRASYDMVVKGVRMGVPFIASLSSPTSLAVELANALNCTLLGYLRGKMMNVYTHAWRVTA